MLHVILDSWQTTVTFWGGRVSVPTRYLKCQKAGLEVKGSCGCLFLAEVGSGRLLCLSGTKDNTLLSYAAQVESCEHSKQTNSQALQYLCVCKGQAISKQKFISFVNTDTVSLLLLPGTWILPWNDSWIHKSVFTCSEETANIYKLLM